MKHRDLTNYNINEVSYIDICYSMNIVVLISKSYICNVSCRL